MGIVTMGKNDSGPEEETIIDFFLGTGWYLFWFFSGGF